MPWTITATWEGLSEQETDVIGAVLEDLVLAVRKGRVHIGPTEAPEIRRTLIEAGAGGDASGDGNCKGES